MSDTENEITPFQNTDPVEALRMELKSLIPACLDARDRILNDVHTAHLLAGSRHHRDFIRHACFNLHRMMEPQHADLLDGPVEIRNTIKKLFIAALDEERGNLRNGEIASIVSEILKEEDDEGRPIIFQYEISDEKGNVTKLDPCPFGRNGEEKLDLNNKDRLFSWLFDALNLCQFEDSSFIASWNIRGYTENQEVLKKHVRGILKSYHIQKSETYIQKEIIDSLSVSSDRVKRADWRYIPLLNGILVLAENAYKRPFKEGGAYTMLRYSRNIYVTNCLNCSFDPSAKSPEMFEMIVQWADNRPQMLRVLEEFVGFCISRSHAWKGCVLLHGEGNCGKTKMLQAVEYMLGADNVVHEQLYELSKDFFLAPLLCKSLCIGDDVHGGEMSDQDQANIKNLTSQGVVQINIKSKQPFQSKIQALLVFAANVLPHFSDWTCRKRIAPIPFLHQFKTNEEKKDIDTVIRSAQARNYLFLAGLRGLIRMEGRRGTRFTDFFTKCDELDASIKQFDCESTPTVEWIRQYLSEHGSGENSMDFTCLLWYKTLPPGELANRSVRALYRNYEEWCNSHKRRPETRKSWKQSVLHYFHGENKTMTTKSDCAYKNLTSGKISTAEFFIVPNTAYSPKERTTAPAKAQPKQEREAKKTDLSSGEVKNADTEDKEIKQNNVMKGGFYQHTLQQLRKKQIDKSPIDQDPETNSEKEHDCNTPSENRNYGLPTDVDSIFGGCKYSGFPSDPDDDFLFEE